MGASSLWWQPPSQREQLGDLVSMRPRAADVEAFGEFWARFAAIARLANCLVLAAAFAIVLSRWLPASATESVMISHWSSGQRDLVIVDHTGQMAWQQATRTAVAEWNAAGSDVHLTWEAGDGVCDEDGARIAFCLVEGTELVGFVDYQGLTTQSGSDDGHADGAVVEACSDCRLDEFERQIVATHEIGHALGLPHNDRITSVMFPNGGTGEPDIQDAAALRRLYAHDD
ncbi:hypothetical protein BH18ACT4_BH18ACT4_01180 [soil metagenome]